MPTKRLFRQAGDLLKIADIRPERAAAILAREPYSPVTQVLKLWGDDEAPFTNLIRANTIDARRWRRDMALILGNLLCDRRKRPVYRGWNFTSAKVRAEFIQSLVGKRVFVNRRIGMSASRSLSVSAGERFLNRFGVLWEIRRQKTARDLSSIFAAIGAKYPEQREVVFPRGSQFILAGNPRQLALVRGRQTLRVPYCVLYEI